MTPSPHNPLADIDPRLLTEVFRRAHQRPEAAGSDPDAILSAILAEARRGTRDMYGLVKAARTTGNPAAV